MGVLNFGEPLAVTGVTALGDSHTSREKRCSSLQTSCPAAGFWSSQKTRVPTGCIDSYTVWHRGSVSSDAILTSSLLELGASAAEAAVVPATAIAECSAKLPPSIASLTSMKEQATPISADERTGQVERARQLMAERQLQAPDFPVSESSSNRESAREWYEEMLRSYALWVIFIVVAECYF